MRMSISTTSGRRLAANVDGLGGAVLGLAYDPDVGLCGEERGEPRRTIGLVVDDEDADGD